MSVFRDKKEWNKWNEIVLASENAREDFRDFSDDIAIIQADKKIQSLLSKNKDLQRQLTEAREETKKAFDWALDITDEDFNSRDEVGNNNKVKQILWEEYKEKAK